MNPDQGRGTSAKGGGGASNPSAAGQSNPWAVDTSRARLIGTRHPWVFITIGVVEMVGGVWLCTSSATRGYSIGFDVAMIAVFIVLGLGTAWPGLWSRGHRAQAAAAADRNWREQADFVRQHPLTAFVVLPVLSGGVAASRAGRLWTHPSVGDYLVLGAAGVLLGDLIQAGIAAVTHRRFRSGQNR